MDFYIQSTAAKYCFIHKDYSRVGDTSLKHNYIFLLSHLNLYEISIRRWIILLYISHFPDHYNGNYFLCFHYCHYFLCSGIFVQDFDLSYLLWFRATLTTSETLHEEFHLVDAFLAYNISLELFRTPLSYHNRNSLSFSTNHGFRI